MFKTIFFILLIILIYHNYNKVEVFVIKNVIYYCNTYIIRLNYKDFLKFLIEKINKWENILNEIDK